MSDEIEFFIRLSDSNVAECELQKLTQQQNTLFGVSHLNVLGGLYHRVHTSRPINSRNENLEDRITADDGLKSSNVSKTKHFSPFFQTKVLSVYENDSKGKQRGEFSFESKANALFDKYSDANDKDMILMDGVEKLCYDLNLQPDDFKILILAWKFNAEQMCQFTRQEFINGCKEMSVQNLLQIQNKLSELVLLLKRDQQQFRNLYKFTFKFGLDNAVGQRILPVDIAVCLWKLVYTLHKPPILDKWLTFLQSDEAHIRGIPRDTWNMFLNFSETVSDDLSSYDDAEAWPSIFDDFVEYEKDSLKQNVIASASCISPVNFHSEEKSK